MTTRSTTRLLTCVLLVFSLCAPMLAIAAPAVDRSRATEFCALTAPFSAALLMRGGAQPDHAPHGPAAPSVVTFGLLHGGDSDPGRLAAAVERNALLSLWTAGPLTGRSPPAIS